MGGCGVKLPKYYLLGLALLLKGLIILIIFMQFVFSIATNFSYGFFLIFWFNSFYYDVKMMFKPVLGHIFYSGPFYGPFFKCHFMTINFKKLIFQDNNIKIGKKTLFFLNIINNAHCLKIYI